MCKFLTLGRALVKSAVLLAWLQLSPRAEGIGTASVWLEPAVGQVVPRDTPASRCPCSLPEGSAPWVSAQGNSLCEQEQITTEREICSLMKMCSEP